MKKTLFLLVLLVALINSQCDVTGCETCPMGTGTCTVCSQGLGYLPAPYATPPPVCNCRSGFYWDTTGENKCLACDNKFQNCVTCVQAYCISCNLAVAQVVLGVCVQPCESIFAGCSACTGTTCTLCDPVRNLTLNANSNGCVCAPGFVKRIGWENLCVPCYYFMPGCKTCTTKTSCDTCSDAPNIDPNTCGCTSNSYRVPSTVYHLDMTCVRCSTFDSNCATCSGSSTCTSCSSSSYYLSAGRCVSCASAHDNCNTCASPSGDCTDCYDSYVVDTPGCSRCDKFIMGCTSCTTVASCDQCDRGNNFKEITTPTTVCECIDQAYKNSTGCHLCSLSLPNCNRCSSATTCTVCADGFYLQSGNCVSCGLGCLACTSGSICDSCDAFDFFVPQSGRCVCESGKVFNGQRCVTCSSEMFGCQTCTNEYTCTACFQSAPMYFLLNSETKKCYCNATMYYSPLTDNCELCVSAITNCQACSNSSYCDQCATGYTEMHTFGPTQSTCEQCSTLMVGCLVCATPTVCTECDSANNFIFSGSSCQCAPAYYLNSGVCQSCTSFSPQCTACTSSGCTACITDYFLNATSKLCQLCTSFSPQCTNCTPTGCTACADDYVVQSTSCARLCNIELCIDCFNSTTCMFCVVHATLNDDRTECNCNTGYFSDTTKCALCSTVIPNCAECESALKCTACEDGFVVDLETDQCVAFESMLKMASLLLVLVFAALSF